MAIITYPLNDVDYDAAAAELYNSTRTSGVYAMSDNFDYGIAGRVFTVGPGLAWMKTEPFTGKAVGVTEPVALEIAAADTVLSRIDRVVLQFSKAANRTQLILKPGSPSSSPVPPERSATALIYELVLYDISIPAGSSEITAADVTDQRGNDQLCGLMRDGISSLNPAPVGVSVEIATGDWDGSAEPYSCVKAVEGVTAASQVIVSGTDGSMDIWLESGCYGAANGNGTITFKALYGKPSAAVTASVLIVG